MSLTRNERARYGLKRFAKKNFICYLVSLPVLGVINFFTAMSGWFSKSSKRIGMAFVSLLFFPVFSSFSFTNVEYKDATEWTIDFGIIDDSVSLSDEYDGNTVYDDYFEYVEEDGLTEAEFIPGNDIISQEMADGEGITDNEVIDNDIADIEAVDSSGSGDLYLDDILSNLIIDGEGISLEDIDAGLSDYITDNTYEDYEFDPTDWRLILVNKSHFIPDDYVVPLVNITDIYQCDERILVDFLSMVQAAKLDGVNLVIRSPYRTSDYQKQLFDYRVARNMEKGMSYFEAYKVSGQAITIPGTSEHEIGLSIDIVADDHWALDEAFADTDEGVWLEANAHYYGFVLRYPKDKEYLTTIEYEPWHFRYVGVEAATVMYNEQLTLEEFWEKYLE